MNYDAFCDREWARICDEAEAQEARLEHRFETLSLEEFGDLVDQINYEEVVKLAFAVLLRPQAVNAYAEDLRLKLTAAISKEI